jgi:hypothetical protein
MLRNKEAIATIYFLRSKIQNGSVHLILLLSGNSFLPV